MRRIARLGLIGCIGLWACSQKTGSITMDDPPDDGPKPVSWIGGGDGLHWSDPANWSTGAVPGTADPAVEVMRARVIVDSALTIGAGQKLAVTDAVLQIARDQTMTNEGEMAMSKGAIYAASGASFMNEGSVSGDGTLATTCSAAVGGGGTTSGDIAVTDAPCLASCRTIDFNGLTPGQTVTDLAASGIIGIDATPAPGYPSRAIVFDSANPTGGDTDLQTPGYGSGNDAALGNLLILAENEVDANGDGLIDDPDDSAGGGSIHFDFGCDVSISAITLVDIEECNGSVDLERFGNAVASVEIPMLDDNSVQTLDLQGNGPVTDVTVNLKGSGAVASMVVCTP